MSNNDKSNEAPGIIEPLADCRHIVERTALLVSKKGLEMERKIRKCNLRNEKFDFLNSSDPCHAFYQQKLTEYSEAPPNQEAVVTTTEDPPPPPSSFSFPHWITLKDRAILKLTAQFVVRYGMPFFQALINIAATTNPHLSFIKHSDPRCYYFTQLISSYPSKITDGTCTQTLVKVFLEQLQLLLEKQQDDDDDDGVEVAMIDLDALVGCVDHMEDQDSFPKDEYERERARLGNWIVDTAFMCSV